MYIRVDPLLLLISRNADLVTPFDVCVMQYNQGSQKKAEPKKREKEMV